MASELLMVKIRQCIKDLNALAEIIARSEENEKKYAEIIVRLSTLLRFATEIKEMDINPLLATEKHVIAVDARIRIEKKQDTEE